MTTQITLNCCGEDLAVTGEYIPAGTLPSEFRISRIDLDGRDVTENYRRMLVIPTLEDMARFVIEAD